MWHSQNAFKPVRHGELPEPADEVVLSTPAGFRPDRSTQCGERGIRGMIISNRLFQSITAGKPQLRTPGRF